MAINYPTDPAGTREARRRRSVASSFRRSDHHDMPITKKAQAEAGNQVAHQLIEGRSPSAEPLAFGSNQAAREAAVQEGLIDATESRRDSFANLADAEARRNAGARSTP